MAEARRGLGSRHASPSPCRTVAQPQGRWRRSTNLWKSLDSWAHTKQFAAICRSHGGSSNGSSTSCGSGDSTMQCRTSRVICRNPSRTMTWSALIQCSVETIAAGRRGVNDRVQIARVIATATRIQEVPPSASRLIQRSRHSCPNTILTIVNHVR